MLGAGAGVGSGAGVEVETAVGSVTGPQPVAMLVRARFSAASALRSQRSFTVVQSDGATTVTEAGGTDTFTVVLTAQPLANVVITVVSANTGEATASPSSLTFTAANWNTAQTVTVTGVNDAVDDGDQTTAVTLSVDDAASDNAFDGVADQTVSSYSPSSSTTVSVTASSRVAAGIRASAL